MTDLEHAQHMLAETERAGKFWTGLAGFLETSAAKWPDLTTEQYDREVEALKCADQAAACRAEWKRWKLRERALLAPQSEAA